MIKLNEKKFREFDLGAEYHQAWHEYEKGHPEFWDDKYMPKRYSEGRIPQNVFMFIYACQKFVKDGIIRYCSEEDGEDGAK